jgi:hypothetical protein
VPARLGVHADVPDVLLAGLRARLVLRERKQVVYLSWPDGVTEEPHVVVKDWDPNQPRDEHGRFSSGGGGEATSPAELHVNNLRDKVLGKLADDVKELQGTEEGRSALARGRELAGRVTEKITAGVTKGVRKALDAADAESRGGISLVAGGLASRDPAAVAHGVAQLIQVVTNCVHEEIFETALAQYSGIPGAHAVGSVAASAATKAETMLLRATAWAFARGKAALTGGRAFEAWLDYKAVTDNGAGDDFDSLPPKLLDAFVQVGVGAAREALKEIAREASIDVPDDYDLAARVRHMLQA